MSAVAGSDGALPRYLSATRAAGLGGGLLLTMALWAAATDVEVVVTAPAAARPDVGVAELRAPVAGHVAEVLGEEGAVLPAGAAVVVLESGVARARWRSARRALLTQRQRLRDLRAAAKLLESGGAAPPELGTEVRVRLAAHRSRLARIDAEHRALEVEQRALRRRAADLRGLLAIREERHLAARLAHQRDAVSRFELLAARRDLVAQRVELDAAADRAEALGPRIRGLRTEREALEWSERQALAEAISALVVEIAEREAAAGEAAERLRLGRIATSMAGVLDRLSVAVGDFVAEGESLGVIVPRSPPLLFETRVPPRQVAFLRPGQRCRIKLDALPFARYGAIDCTVELLGEDVVTDDQSVAYYRVKVRPAARVIHVQGQAVRLQPGTTGWVDIITGRRSVLGFVTEPLRRFAMESLRER